MWRDPYPRQGWAEWLIGWIFTLILLAFAAEALAQLVKPLLPWIGLGVLVFVSLSVGLRQRDRW